MQQHEKIYKQFNKELRNKNNSLQDLKDIFIKHYSIHPHYNFEFAVLKSIIHNQHTEIFKFLFNNGFSYSIDYRILDSFSKKITNQEHKQYFIYFSLKLIAGHPEIPECIQLTHSNFFSFNDENIHNFDNYDPMLQKRIIFSLICNTNNISITGNQINLSENLYPLFFDKIKNNEKLFSFLKFILFSDHKPYICSTFIDYLQELSFFDDIDLSLIIKKYDLKNFVIKQIEKNIHKKDIAQIIKEPFRALIRKKGLDHSMIKIIFNTKDNDLIIYLSHQIIIYLKYEFSYIQDDIISYFLSFDFPEKIIKYHQFLFNKNFNLKNYNEHYNERIYNIFINNLDIIKEKHNQKFINNIDYLDERIKTFFLMENF